MAINYASKYSGNVQEKFTEKAVSNAISNNNLDFSGVNAVTVYSVGTAAMNDYSMSGDGRYGVASELQNTIQTLTMSKDRSFTFTIDRRNYTDTQMVMESGRALARQLEEVVIPEVEKYRFSKVLAATTPITTAITSAYDAFLDGTTALAEKNVPLESLVAYITPAFYKMVKQDAGFIKACDIAQNMLLKGQIGELDGVPLILSTESILGENVKFIIAHRGALEVAQKIEDYKIHDNPPGISGWLVEGRMYYDAWVLDKMKDAIYAHVVATAKARTK